MGTREQAVLATLTHFGLAKTANRRQQILQALGQTLRTHGGGIATGAGLGAGVGSVVAGETADPTQSYEQHVMRRLKGGLIGGVLGGITGGLGSKGFQKVNPELFQKLKEGPFPNAPALYRESRSGNTAADRAARMLREGVKSEDIPASLLDAVQREKQIYGKMLPLEHAAQGAFNVYMHPATRLLAGTMAGKSMAERYANSVAHHRLSQLAALKGQREAKEEDQYANARLEALKANYHMGDYRSSLDKG